MYAIVEIAGKQYKVHENDKLVVPRLSGDVDDTVTFDRVLLVANGDDDIQLGTPVVPNATVTATIVEHVKGDKILVFRKKRRKRFKVKRGHRQPYTRIEIGDLSVDGGAQKVKKTSKPASKGSAKTQTDAKAEQPDAKTEQADGDVKNADTKGKATEVTEGKHDQEAAAAGEKEPKGDKKATKAPKSDQAALDASEDSGDEEKDAAT